MLALPVLWNPPSTSITEAAIRELPLADMAELELESTTNSPGILMLPLPETVRAPVADGLSTKIEGATTTGKVIMPLPPATSVAVRATT